MRPATASRSLGHHLRPPPALRRPRRPLPPGPRTRAPRLPVARHSLRLVADTDEEARETWWRYWQPVVVALAKERGFCAPTRERYQAEINAGALFVGSPETVARKIAAMARDLHLSRSELTYDLMSLPRDTRPARSTCWVAKSPRVCRNCSPWTASTATSRQVLNSLGAYTPLPGAGALSRD
ncbi:hypothetical protein [Streptomyces coeruleorubidus]|uniref:hypothetical protein n=1 Tax=Streptomyces coeruleorubidus TaxID=116188 RepID=UPI0036BA341E